MEDVLIGNIARIAMERDASIRIFCSVFLQLRVMPLRKAVRKEQVHGHTSWTA